MGYLDLYLEAKEEGKEKKETKPLIGYSFKRSQEYYSGLLEESYLIEGENIVFMSGVTYTPQEMEALKGLGDEEKKKLHEVKRTLGGKIKEKAK